MAKISQVIKSIFRKPIVIEDEFFGWLQEEKPTFLIEAYFICTKLFEPTNQYIAFSFANAEIRQEQKDFYNYVAVNYWTLVNKIELLMDKTLENWRKNYKIYCFSKQCGLLFFDIPFSFETGFEWRMYFEDLTNDHIQIGAFFKDYELTEVIISR